MAKQNKNQNQGQSINYSQITCNWGGMTLQIPSAVIQEYQQHSCCPPPNQIFRAFELCPLNKVKVVIIGQDPYPENKRGKADGLAFSNDEIYDSLKSIKKEVDRAGYCLNSPDLKSWAQQGVLLMNTCLSVRKGVAKSHHNLGWEDVIEKVLEELNNVSKPIVFLLWGDAAITLAGEKIKNSLHQIEKASHPTRRYAIFKKSTNLSQQSFLGCDHFKKANEFLQKHGINPINWNT